MAVNRGQQISGEYNVVVCLLGLCKIDRLLTEAASKHDHSCSVLTGVSSSKLNKENSRQRTGKRITMAQLTVVLNFW